VVADIGWAGRPTASTAAVSPMAYEGGKSKLLHALSFLYLFEPWAPKVAVRTICLHGEEFSLRSNGFKLRGQSVNFRWQLLIGGWQNRPHLRSNRPIFRTGDGGHELGSIVIGKRQSRIRHGRDYQQRSPTAGLRYVACGQTVIPCQP